MDNKALSYLLKIVNNNSDISPLISLGYCYSQIALLLSKAVEEGYLVHENLSYGLSREGMKFLSDYSDENNETGIERWVLPQAIKKVPPCGKYDIVLPDKI